ncbi:MAG TPA: right-handed parallel beta-helix repeat-containing protein [Blastocatellia bacterium]|nr:right-handed parallel beta-helix repeat-containing protein [Blastocatellia bacterium]
MLEHRSSRITLSLIILALILPSPSFGARVQRAALPQTAFTVTNLNDSGPGSLRQAILDANSHSGADTISFQAGLTGTILLTTGELLISDSLTITGPAASSLVISGNHASRVFEVASGNTIKLSSLTISQGNAHFSDGGGIFNDGGTVTLANVVLSENSASEAGGITNNNGGTVSIIDSTLSNNSCIISGGAIRNNGGIVTLANSTLYHNFSINGGGIANNGGTLTLTNCTLSDNSAGLGDGGAIVVDSGTANISNCTLVGNSAGAGGGFNTFGTVNIKNSILANNLAAQAGNDCVNEGTVNALGINLTTEDSCYVFPPTPPSGFTLVTLAQLKLGPLQVNAPGTAATYALLPGSVAIDAVTDCTDVFLNPVTQDQRGVARPQDGDRNGVFRCDVGAYEASPPFDLCVQDDSSGSLLQINTSTGEYQFTNCAGLTVGGSGTLTRRGSTITLQHNASDRRVTATIDTATGKATAAIQLYAQGRTFSITDRNINNNTCACR